jgi:branched-subunit amino acid transport protein
MSTFDIWLTIALLTLSTILTRSSFFVLGHVKLPHKVQHALRYAPAAAMAAIVIPDLVLPGAPLMANLSNPKLLATLGAVGCFLLTRHLLGTIIAGMALFTVLRLVL